MTRDNAEDRTNQTWEGRTKAELVLKAEECP